MKRKQMLIGSFPGKVSASLQCYKNNQWRQSQSQDIKKQKEPKINEMEQIQQGQNKIYAPKNKLLHKHTNDRTGKHCGINIYDQKGKCEESNGNHIKPILAEQCCI